MTGGLPHIRRTAQQGFWGRAGAPSSSVAARTADALALETATKCACPWGLGVSSASCTFWLHGLSAGQAGSAWPLYHVLGPGLSCSGSLQQPILPAALACPGWAESLPPLLWRCMLWPGQSTRSYARRWDVQACRGACWTSQRLLRVGRAPSRRAFVCRRVPLAGPRTLSPPPPVSLVAGAGQQ